MALRAVERGVATAGPTFWPIVPARVFFLRPQVVHPTDRRGAVSTRQGFGQR